ncbi:hypothetical protein ACFPRL_29120 [Pseudoclavibacter helvolus]
MHPATPGRFHLGEGSPRVSLEQGQVHRRLWARVEFRVSVMF